MIQVLSAITSKFNTTSALTDRFTKLYLSQAPDDEKLSTPVCVLTVVAATPEYSTMDLIKNVRVQFSVFALTDTAGLEGVADIKAAFDFATLPIPYFIVCRRINEGVMKIDKRVWNCYVEYMIEAAE